MEGYGRLWKATEGYGRLRKATEGYGRLRKATVTYLNALLQKTTHEQSILTYFDLNHNHANKPRPSCASLVPLWNRRNWSPEDGRHHTGRRRFTVTIGNPAVTIGNHR